MKDRSRLSVFVLDLNHHCRDSDQSPKTYDQKTYPLKSKNPILFASADPAHHVGHHRQSSTRKASVPSSVRERSTARGKSPDFECHQQPDCPTTRTVAVSQSQETTEMPLAASPPESSRSHKR